MNENQKPILSFSARTRALEKGMKYIKHEMEFLKNMAAKDRETMKRILGEDAKNLGISERLDDLEILQKFLKEKIAELKRDLGIGSQDISS